MASLKIEFNTVYVSDQQRALDFYTQQLGFEVRQDDTMPGDLRWLTVALPDRETGIVLASGYGAGEGADARVGTFTGVGFTTDDIQALYEQLSGRGVEFTEAPTMQPWGLMQAQFADPDGNVFVVTQPGE